MNFDQYQALCAAAIASLNTASIAVTAVKGDSFTLNGVTLDLLFDEPQSVLSVVCHLGQPADAHRTQVYEQLLYLQTMTLHLTGVRFCQYPEQ